MQRPRHLCRACRSDITARLKAAAGKPGRPPLYCKRCSLAGHAARFAEGYRAALDDLHRLAD